MIDLNFPNPVDTTEDFFNREAELAEIHQTLASTAQRPIVIIGETKIGKTSLINTVTSQVESKDLFKVLHLPHTYSRDALAAEIVQGICDKLGTDLRQRDLINEHGQFRLVTISGFISVLNNLLQQKPPVSFLLCIDRLDSMLNKCDDVAADQMLDLLLYLIEKTDLPLRFLFSMTRINDRILRSYASPFLLSSNLVQLTPWSFEQSCQFARWILKDRLVLSEAAERDLFDATGGHPYFIKAILQILLDQQSEPEGFSITSEFLRLVVDTSIHSPEVDFTLSNLVEAHFSLEELRLLTEITSRREGLSVKAIRDLGDLYLEIAYRLVARGYLTVSKQKEAYFLRLGLLGQWLEQKSFTPLTDTKAEDTLFATREPQPSSGVVLNDTTRQVWVDGREIRLTNVEYRTLFALAERIGEIVSKAELVREIWPKEPERAGVSDTRIYQIVHRLRKLITGDYLQVESDEGFVLFNARVESTPDVVVTKRRARGL